VDDSLVPPVRAEVVLSVPEIRDYRTINGELVRHLDQGCQSFRLTGVNGHRLLVAGLAGSWTAVIEVVGGAGPELAAEMDAPGVTVVCRGSTADGGASRLKSGRVLILGAAGPAFGYALRGGLAMVVGTSGARAGLRQLGGDLILFGHAGPLAGERQLGGRLLTHADLGPHAGRGRLGGRFIRMDVGGGVLGDAEDRAAMGAALSAFNPWLSPASDQTPP
jgi:methylamine---glutamate N-methyltransferase subunit B